MAARIRHTALALIGIMLLAGVAYSESQPLPDIDATVEARGKEE